MFQQISATDAKLYAEWFWNRYRPWLFGPFRYGMFPRATPVNLGNTLHDWDYVIEPTGTVFGTLNNQASINVHIARLLIETGIAVTPAGQPLNDLRAGFAVLRYADYFANLGGNTTLPLTVNNDPALRSTRFKACMAEELASGIACFLLREHLDVVHIVDYQVWRNLTNATLVGTRPDYYCVTSSGEALLVEVKGTITTRRSPMTKARATARIQVANGVFDVLVPQRAAGCRFTIASNLIIGTTGNQRSITYIERVAPAPTPGIPPNVNGPQLDAAALSFSKIFRYVGLDDPAERIIEGERMDFDLPKQFESKLIENENFTVIGIDPFGNVILLQTDILQDLKAGRKPNLPKSSNMSRREVSDKPSDKALIVLNEFIVAHPNPEILGARY